MSSYEWIPELGSSHVISVLRHSAPSDSWVEGVLLTQLIAESPQVEVLLHVGDEVDHGTYNTPKAILDC